MSIFKKISKVFKSSGDDRNYWFFVQCDHCKEVLKGRVDMHNHLSIKYGEGKNPNTYYCRKVMIGSNRCYRQIEVELNFDANRKLVERQITGGVFVAESDYQKDNN
jgi:hypothetical protein